MIIVAGYIDVVEESAERAESIVRTMMAETRREAGCAVYDITRSVERPGRFHVYEEWETLAALEAHFDTPHMKVFRQALADLTVLERSVSRREAGAATPL